MTATWPIVRLGDYAEVKGGKRLPKGSSLQTTPNGSPYIRIVDWQDGAISKSNLLYVPAEAQQQIHRYRIHSDDVFISIVGTVGLVARIDDELDDAFLTENAAKISVMTDQLDSSFLRYFLSSSRGQEEIKSRSVGSTQPKLALHRIKDLSLPLPSRGEQRAIAEVLGALDDKIAANTKLAETADELASSDFRRSLLTASYSDSTFADLARVSGGGTPSTKVPEYWDGGVLWATPTDVTALHGPYLEKTSRTISDAGLAACASELYPAETILMTSRATIGAFALTQRPTAVNQGFIAVQAYDPDLHFWLFHEMRSRTDEFISLANGATFLELSRGNFKKFKVRLAAQDEMRRFNETAKVLHKTAREALQENRILATTRDALLPQLMSGKLRVKDIENTMGEMV